ncbi:MAG: hypothetical protein WEB58_10470 [Planctomycetaceae bacterium]
MTPDDARVLCVIPARGGSRRLPMKNIYPLLGKPSLEYTIESIREAATPVCPVVLTDHAEIASLAQKLGVDVLDEPAELATDSLVDDSVILSYVIDRLENESRTFDIIVVQYPCVPIKPSGIVDALIAFLKRTEADFVQTMALVSPDVHPYRMMLADDEGRTTHLVPMGPNMMSHEYPPYFCLTRAGYAITRAALKRLDGAPLQDLSIALDRRGLVHKMEECVDIDNPEDVAWAEFLLNRKRDK